MIEGIVIKDVATFDNSVHVMENLGKLNFIFAPLLMFCSGTIIARDVTMDVVLF